MKELVIIGDMWHEHGCRPFKGDPAQIIKAIAEEVFNERMEAQRRLGEAVSKVTFLADYRKSKDDKTPPPSPTSPGGASGGYESGLSAMQANPAA